MNFIEIIVLHGTIKYSIFFPNGRTSEIATVKELSAKLEKISGVPIIHQRLKTKGKILSKMTASLMSPGIKSGCKIVLFDNRPNALYKLVKNMVESLENNLESIVVDMNILRKGFLSRDFACKKLIKLHRRVKHLNEKFVETSEQFNAMTIREIRKMTKTQRRGLADRMQKLVRRTDQMAAIIQSTYTGLMKSIVQYSKS